MRAIALLITLTASLLGGCSLFGDNFSKAEALLVEIRDVDVQHNDMNDNLPQKVDEIKVATLNKEYQLNEQRSKVDRVTMVDLQKELRKIQQNNQYKLQYLSKLIKKITSIQAKVTSIEEPFQEIAMDTVEILNKQYKAEQQLITYDMTQVTNTITNITNRLNGKTPPPYQHKDPPIDPLILKRYQTGVDGYIKSFQQQLDEEKKKEDLLK